MYFMVTFSSLAMLVGVPIREGKSGPRGGPPPLQGWAWIQPKGRIAVQKDLLKEVTMVDKWNKVIRKKVPYISVASYPPGQIQVYDTKGDRIDPKDLPKLLGQPVPVLVSADGKKVDSSYLRTVKQQTLVLVLHKN